MNIFVILINIIPAVLLSIIIQLAFHEIGHMLAGLITGWRLIYLQLYHLALIKENSKYRIKLVPTLNCRCIMYPKDLYQGATLYTLGGISTNLLLTVTGLAGMIGFLHRPILRIYMWSFFASGIMLLITNATPNTKRVCNDMACLKLIRNDTLSMISHNAQMMIAQQLFEGMTYRQIEPDLICLTGEKVYTDILAYQVVLEYYFNLDQDKYIPARKALDKIKPEAPISQEVRNIINMELLYIELLEDILNKRNKVKTNPRYINGIEEYIREYEGKGDIHSGRVKATWEAYRFYSRGDNKAAIDHLDQKIAEMDSAKYLYLGEKLFCMDQLTSIRNLLWRDLIMEKRTGTDSYN